VNRRLAALVGAARYLGDVAAFAGPAAVYIASASHEPGAWDTAELQGVPYVLGIPHPSGFPFYVLLGYAWSHLVALDTIAFRMNVMSGVAIAAACAAAYAIARELGARRAIALPATLWFAFTADVWQHASRAESQDLAVGLEAIALYAFVRWMKGGDGRWYAAAFALAGLAMAAHPNALWLFGGLLLGSAIAKPRPSRRLVLRSLALTALGLALYLYLPLRSAYVVAHGLDPTLALVGTGGGVFVNYDNPSTLHGLLLEIGGGASGAPHDFLSSFNPVHVPAALQTLVLGIAQQFSPLAAALSAVGLFFAIRRDWRVALTLFAACAAALLFAVTYANEGDMARYRILALLLVVPLIGSIEFAGDRLRAAPGIAALALVLTFGAATAFVAHANAFHRVPGEGGRWIITAVRPYVPPGSIVLAGWLDATSLAYGAYADGSLPGRVIVSGDATSLVDDYPVWARASRVFLLVNPSYAGQLSNTRLVATLDPWHAILRVVP
jgi:hypothetical protein